MTQPNQSELIEGTPGYKLHYDMTQICLANGGVTKPMVDKLYAYITANYTPNSEVEQRIQDAYKRGYTTGVIDNTGTRGARQSGLNEKNWTRKTAARNELRTEQRKRAGL